MVEIAQWKSELILYIVENVNFHTTIVLSGDGASKNLEPVRMSLERLEARTVLNMAKKCLTES